MTHCALILTLALIGTASAISDWNNPSSAQYHIQTDEGPERYFRYQTVSGQYRKEKRLEDGTVVGSYAWIDDDGFLRQRDYIADNAGYRILKTKNVYVGRETPIAQAIKAAKKTAPSAGTLVKTNKVPGVVPTVVVTARPPPLLSVTTLEPTPLVEISHNSIPSSTPSSYLSAPDVSSVSSIGSTTSAPNLYLPAGTADLGGPSTKAPFGLKQWYYSSGPQYENNHNLYKYNDDENNDKYSLDKQRNNFPYTFNNGPTYPIDTKGQSYTGNNNLGNGYDPQYPYYDGVSVTNDGFRYYIPRAYHEEQNLGNNEKSGSFGYIDPFGIRRVIYYNAAPGTGFQHRKNNRYVGFDATPYDPRPY